MSPMQGMLHAAQIIVSNDGVLGLWRGTLPAVQRAALVNLGELATYDQVKKEVVIRPDIITMLTHLKFLDDGNSMSACQCLERCFMPLGSLLRLLIKSPCGNLYS